MVAAVTSVASYALAPWAHNTVVNESRILSAMNNQLIGSSCNEQVHPGKLRMLVRAGGTPLITPSSCLAMTTVYKM